MCVFRYTGQLACWLHRTDRQALPSLLDFKLAFQIDAILGGEKEVKKS